MFEGLDRGEKIGTGLLAAGAVLLIAAELVEDDIASFIVGGVGIFTAGAGVAGWLGLYGSSHDDYYGY